MGGGRQGLENKPTPHSLLSCGSCPAGLGMVPCSGCCDLAHSAAWGQLGQILASRDVTWCTGFQCYSFMFGHYPILIEGWPSQISVNGVAIATLLAKFLIPHLRLKNPEL